MRVIFRNYLYLKFLRIRVPTAYCRGQLGPQTSTPRGAPAFPHGLKPGQGACASLSLLRPPSPYFSSLSPPPVAAAAARPRQFRPTRLPSPTHSFAAAVAGEMRGPPQVGARSRGRGICTVPTRAVPGSVVGRPKNCPRP